MFQIWDHLYEKGDSFINAWILAWNAHALRHLNLGFWDAPIFYPVKNTLAFSEAMFGNLWITYPVQCLTGNSTFAANTLLIVSFVLTSYCGFWLVRDITGSFWSGLIAGLLFSFNPYRWGHAGHLQLQPFFWSILSVFYANRFMTVAKSRYLVGIFITIIIQYYASVYLGTMLIVLLFVLFFVHVFIENKYDIFLKYIRNKRILIVLIFGSLVTVFILFPLGYQYIRASSTWHFIRSIDENVMFSAEPLSFFLRRSYGFANYDWLHRFFESKIPAGETAVFVGITPWILAFLTIIRLFQHEKHFTVQQRMLIKRYSWALVIIGIFMLGPFLKVFNQNTGIPLPYQILYYGLPGVKAIRVPARLVQSFLLCLVVIGSFAVASFFQPKRGRSWIAKTVIIPIALIAVNWDYGVRGNDGVSAEVMAQFPPVYHHLAQSDRAGPILELPVGEPGKSRYAFKYHHYQTAHWRPSLGGMSGFYPPGRLALFNHTRDCPSQECSQFLTLTPAETLVIHLDKYSAATAQKWMETDLTPFGFAFSGQFENALVWERLMDLDLLSEKLSVSSIHRNIRNNIMTLDMVLQPAIPENAWRYLTGNRSLVNITVETRSGKINRYFREYSVPPYLLPGETFRVNLVLPIDAYNSQQIATVEVEGPLIVLHRVSN